MNWALVLQGGGVRTAYTSGVLEYCAYKKLFPSYVSASSAAVLSALYFLSSQTESLRHLWQTAIRNDVVNPKRLRKNGYVFNNQRLLELLFSGNHAIDHTAFKDSPTPLYASLMNSKNYEGRYVEVLSDDLEDIVLASIAHPLAHPAPHTWNKQAWYDGGFYSPIPLEILWGKPFDALVVVRTDNLARSHNRMELTPMERAYMNIPGSMSKLWRIYKKRIEEQEVLIDEMKNHLPIFVVSPSRRLPTSLVDSNIKHIYKSMDYGYSDAQVQLSAFLEKLDS